MNKKLRDKAPTTAWIGIRIKSATKDRHDIVCKLGLLEDGKFEIHQIDQNAIHRLPHKHLSIDSPDGILEKYSDEFYKEFPHLKDAPDLFSLPFKEIYPILQTTFEKLIKIIEFATPEKQSELEIIEYDILHQSSVKPIAKSDR